MTSLLDNFIGFATIIHLVIRLTVSIRYLAQ